MWDRVKGFGHPRGSFGLMIAMVNLNCDGEPDCDGEPYEKFSGTANRRAGRVVLSRQPVYPDGCSGAGAGAGCGIGQSDSGERDDTK